MGLDMKKLGEAEKELDKKSGTSKNWIQLSKIDKTLDIKIMDPLPSMQGIYYVEVPVHWINGTRIISPKLYGPSEHDPIQIAIDEAKAAKDPDILKLLNAKDETKKNAPKVQLKYEYWIPVLKFNWTLDAQEQIKGIWNPDGTANVDLINQFVEDGQWKILVTGIQALKAINKIATSRGGFKMVNKVDGFCITMNKSGVDRNTVYSALKADDLPMPDKYYTDDIMIDPFEIAESLMFTNEYMDMVIGKYLYNEPCPEKPEDEHYRNLELREKLKSKLAEEEAPAPVAAQRTRPGRTPAPVATEAAATHTPTRGSHTGPVATPAPAVTEEDPKLVEARRILAEAEAAAGKAVKTPVTPPPTRGRGSRSAAATTGAAPAAHAAAPGRGGARPQRNLSADLNNVD